MRLGSISRRAYRDALRRVDEMRAELSAADVVTIGLRGDLADAQLELEQWKAATGLVDGHGDPDGVTPTHLREELSILRLELDQERKRHTVYVGGTRGGKTAATIEECSRQLNELCAMVPALEENSSTRAVARRMRAILGMPSPTPHPEEGEGWHS